MKKHFFVPLLLAAITFFSLSGNASLAADSCSSAGFQCVDPAAPCPSGYSENASCSTTCNGGWKYCAQSGLTTTSSASASGCASGYTEQAGVCFPSSGGAAALSQLDVLSILSTLLIWFFSIFAVVSIMAFVISGFQYLLAAGDSKIIETAKRNMTYSMVGVAVGLGAVIIVKTIFLALWGVGITSVGL